MLKKFLIGTFALLALTVAVSASAAYDFGTTTLKVGSKGAAVMAVQTVVGATVDGTFGPMTGAKVKVWQAANGLTADGAFGPASKAKANATVIVTGGTFPAGCTSAVGFSSTTGLPCSTVTTFPAGCTSAVGYSSTTGEKCDGSTTGSTGALVGGAGDIILSSTSTNVKDEVKEGGTEAVLAFKAQADGSDLAVTSAKLTLSNTAAGASSEKLSDYLDTVDVYLGSTKVGSADVSSFTRTSGTPDVFTKTIALTNAVVRDGASKKGTFTVKVTAKDSIDSTDITDAHWTATLDSVRFQDATGVIMSNTPDDVIDNIFTFKDASSLDNIDIISSSSNPAATSLQVEKDTVSDSYLVGAFKLKTATDSGDIQINEIPVNMAIAVNDVDNGNNIQDAIIDSVTLKINGTEYTADNTTPINTATGTAIYTATFDNGELVIGSGETVEVKIYATFNDQKDNYKVGTTVTAGIGNDTIDAEGVVSGDTVHVDGMYTGKAQTLTVDVPTATIEGTPTFALYSASTDTASSIYLATMKFNVTASDSADIWMSNEIPGDLAYTIANTANDADLSGDVTSVTLTATNDIEQTHSFLVGAGSTEEFTLKFYVKGSNVTGKITVTGLKYGTADTVLLNDDASISTLTNFKAQTYLAR